MFPFTSAAAQPGLLQHPEACLGGQLFAINWICWILPMCPNLGLWLFVLLSAALPGFSISA